MSNNEGEAFDFQPSPTYLCDSASRKILTGPAASALLVAIQKHTDTYEEYLVSMFEKEKHARRLNRHSILTIDARKGPDGGLCVTMESSCPEFDNGILGTKPWKSKFIYVLASDSDDEEHFECMSLDPIPSTRPTTSNLSGKKAVKMQSALESLKRPRNEALLSSSTSRAGGSYNSTRGSRTHAGGIQEEEEEE